MTLYIEIFISRALFLTRFVDRIKIKSAKWLTSALLCWWHFKCRFNLNSREGMAQSQRQDWTRPGAEQRHVYLWSSTDQRACFSFVCVIRILFHMTRFSFILHGEAWILSRLILSSVVMLRKGMLCQTALFSVINTLLSYVSFSVFPYPFQISSFVTFKVIM